MTPKDRLTISRFEKMVTDIPHGNHPGWNRYDTQDTHTLHIWADGKSYDILVPKVTACRPPFPRLCRLLFFLHLPHPCGFLYRLGLR